MEMVGEELFKIVQAGHGVEGGCVNPASNTPQTRQPLASAHVSPSLTVPGPCKLGGQRYVDHRKTC